MIDISADKFSDDAFLRQVQRTQAMANGIRPYIYCNEFTKLMFNIGNKYNGSDVVIDEELDDCVFIIVSRRDDKRGNVVLPYIVGNISDAVFTRLYFAFNDYKWLGYPNNIIKKEKINIIEKTLGIKISDVDCGYCMCEELIRLDEEKWGDTSYPVVGIGSNKNDKPVIWCKSDVGDEWSVVTPEKDENGQYHHFCIPEARAEKLVNVKYFYKKEVGDWWFMGKCQVKRGTE